MSRKLHILYGIGEQEKIHSWTAVLQNGICTITDELLPDSYKPNLGKYPYVSEYAMIQQIVRDFNANDGYMVIDTGEL